MLVDVAAALAAIVAFIDTPAKLISVLGALLAASLRLLVPLLRFIQAWKDVRKLKVEGEIDPAGVVRVTALTEAKGKTTITALDAVRDQGLFWFWMRVVTGLNFLTHLKVIPVTWHSAAPTTLSALSPIQRTGHLLDKHSVQQLRNKWIQPMMLRIEIGTSVVLRKMRVTKGHIMTAGDKLAAAPAAGAGTTSCEPPKAKVTESTNAHPESETKKSPLARWFRRKS